MCSPITSGGFLVKLASRCHKSKPARATRIARAASQFSATAKYVFHLHDEWEHKSTNTSHAWGDGSNPGTERWTMAVFDSPMAAYTYDGPTGSTSDQISWEIKRTTTMKLEANFDANFKANDFISFGASSSIGQETTITKPSGASVKLAPGERAIPYMQVVWTRDFFLLDHYTTAGWDKSAGSDGKWSKWYDHTPDFIEAHWFRTSGGVDPSQDRSLPSSSPHQTGPHGEF